MASPPSAPFTTPSWLKASNSTPPAAATRQPARSLTPTTARISVFQPTRYPALHRRSVRTFSNNIAERAVRMLKVENLCVSKARHQPRISVINCSCLDTFLRRPEMLEVLRCAFYRQSIAVRRVAANSYLPRLQNEIHVIPPP
jgi:hypothetical protein